MSMNGWMSECKWHYFLLGDWNAFLSMLAAAGWQPTAEHMLAFSPDKASLSSRRGNTRPWEEPWYLKGQAWLQRSETGPELAPDETVAARLIRTQRLGLTAGSKRREPPPPTRVCVYVCVAARLHRGCWQHHSLQRSHSVRRLKANLRHSQSPSIVETHNLISVTGRFSSHTHRGVFSVLGALSKCSRRGPPPWILRSILGQGWVSFTFNRYWYDTYQYSYPYYSLKINKWCKYKWCKKMLKMSSYFIAAVYKCLQTNRKMHIKHIF